MAQDAERSEARLEQSNLVLTVACDVVRDVQLAASDSLTACGLSEAQLRDLAAVTLANVNITDPVEISVLLTDDEGIRALNRQYRAKDVATDVLSFPLLDEPLVEAPPEVLWQPLDEEEPSRPTYTVGADGLIYSEGESTIMSFPEGKVVDSAYAEVALRDMLAVEKGSGPEFVHESETGHERQSEDEYDDEELSEDAPLLLGDIVISLDTVTRQAAQAGHSSAWELAYLLSHGVLHLVGFDDHTEAGYAAMVSLQEVVLGSVGISRG